MAPPEYVKDPVTGKWVLPKKNESNLNFYRRHEAVGRNIERNRLRHLGATLNPYGYTQNELNAMERSRGVSPFAKSRKHRKAARKSRKNRKASRKTRRN